MSKENIFGHPSLLNAIPITEQRWGAKQQPLVSISCITYNHVSFIREAIEGFLMQKTTFPVELLIHDDASNDGTAEIIEEYERAHPSLFFPTYQTKNQFSQGVKVGVKNRERARGKYIALCEGDDYWTDPLKLQKQVELMEKQPQASMSVARCGRKDLTTGVYTPDKLAFKEKSLLLYFDDKKPYFHTSTFLIRKHP